MSTKRGKEVTLKGCDSERALDLAREISKVRCWITGWQAGRSTPGQLRLDGPPGVDALRQLEIILKDSVQ